MTQNLRGAFGLVAGMALGAAGHAVVARPAVVAMPEVAIVAEPAVDAGLPQRSLLRLSGEELLERAEQRRQQGGR